MGFKYPCAYVGYIEALRQNLWASHIRRRQLWLLGSTPSSMVAHQKTVAFSSQSEASASDAPPTVRGVWVRRQ